MDWTKLISAAGIADALVYVAMIVLFLLGVIKCVIPVINTRGLLRRAIKNIKAGNDAKRSWQDDKFLGKGSLFPHWSEYLNNLFFADGAYHNASSIEDYINEETVIDAPGRSVLADAIPGMLVSLGFLGTLIGLSTGLADFDMSNSSSVQISIETLIPSMRYAFMTSIVGVICSVVFNIIVRITNGFADNSLTDFYQAMKKYAGVLSVDPMTQVAIYQQEQTALIQKLERDLSQEIEAGVRPLQKSFHEFANVATQEQMRFLSAVVDRFVDQMDQTLKGELRDFAVTLEQTSRQQDAAQESYKANLREIETLSRDIAQYQRASEQTVAKFDGYLNRVGVTQTASDDAFRKMSAAIERIDGVSRQQNAYLQTITSSQTEINRAAVSFQQTSEKFMAAFTDAAQKSAASLNKAAAGVDAGAKALDGSHKALVNQINKDLEETLNIFDQNMRSVIKQLGMVVNEISSSVEGLPRAVSGASKSFEEQLREMTATLQRAQSALDAAAARVR